MREGSELMRRAPAPKSRPFLRRAVCSLAVIAIYAAMILGCFHAATTIDYTKEFPPSIAFSVVRQVLPRDAWSQTKQFGVPWFVASSAVIWTGVLLTGNRPRPRRVLLAAGLFVPFLVDIRGPIAAPFMALLSPFISFELLLGPSGETISEGKLVLAAAGWWWLLNAVLLFRAFRSNPIAPYTCSKCGYDLRGLASTICPECGSIAPSDLSASSTG